MSKALTARSKFAELRALRESGKKRLDSYEVQQEADLYEEVDEEGYKKIIRDRINQDDFVIDDNGEGYADDGREDWDHRSQNGYETEEDFPTRTKRGREASTSHREQEKDRKAKVDKGISDYFSRGNPPTLPKQKPTSITKADQDFFAKLLLEVDSTTTETLAQFARPKKTSDKRRIRELSPVDGNRPRVPKKAKIEHDATAVISHLKQDWDESTPSNFTENDSDFSDDLPPPLAVKASETTPEAEVTIDDEDDETLTIAQATGTAIASVNLSAIRPALKTPKAEEHASLLNSSPIRSHTKETIDASAWNNITKKLNVLDHNLDIEKSRFGKLDYDHAIEDDGSLRFFWTDYLESNDSLCFFGKVRDRTTGTFVSSFVKIDNIFRKLFFLPREFREASKEKVEMKDVYEEVDNLMTSFKVGMHKIKPCVRKYAFEIPNVPKEGEYLKLLYPYSKPQLQPQHLTGSTYSHVFGTNTPLFEQFVLWKHIMGPCWLVIHDAEFGVLKNASHCKLEVQVSKPNSIYPLSDNDIHDAPPLTLMSISLRTMLNTNLNKQEILAISARVYDNVVLTDTTPIEKLPCKSFTVIRPFHTQFPIGFEAGATKYAKGHVKLVKQERELLSFFLAALSLDDPDVLIGHQLEGVDFSILLSRLQANRTPQWSRIGRMNRSQWPMSIGKDVNIFTERSILSGRLLCDLANEFGKSTMTKCSSWSLTEMCSLYLGGIVRRDIDTETASKTWATTKEGLIDYISHCESDTYFIAALALTVQMLPLTKVLTNLAGNSWARTLTGTRSERNEYILLHEFHKSKFICPDKPTFKNRQSFPDDNPEEANLKKDKYKGGLVFDPEKGLYDKYVLVMDFNSLYPSIIQEFNICFTTVDRTNLSLDEEQVPEVPQGQELGILPKLISTLVSRRRQVKALMKDKNAKSDQLATWDIKQLALKLTANSMYGCLGYTRSRFYARPLAVLTTFKGREILQSTKDLAESSSFHVIYGDTDSVMINTNMTNIDDALKVGNEFKKAVNARYKLLEIEIDNVFRRILLQQKKKYAAISLVHVNGKYVEKMEIKGLDMKRREFCNLSKDISSKILDEILSGDDPELVVTHIHEYLREVSEKMRKGNVPISKYTIYTKLGKAPKDYPNGESMPQVQVALREISKGKVIRKDDVIAYIVTGDSRNSSEPAAKRSYAPQDVIKTDSGLLPDVEWYLYKQIFPPVERLCANISGTDTLRLADCLGLDIKKYSTTNNATNSSAEFKVDPLESQISDEVRFKDACRLSLFCRRCKDRFEFEGLQGSLRHCSPSGIVCTCGYVLSDISVVAQLEYQIRQQTSKYYEGWLICDDQACGNRTRQMSVYGYRCLGPQILGRGCLGKMRYEYTEKMMYNQLLYFASLFDVEKAKNNYREAEKEEIIALAEHNRVRFSSLKSTVKKYLDKCGRQWVSMDSLFGKLGLGL